MNSFERIISNLSLNADSQSDAGWFYAICQYAAAGYEGADVFSNPVKEVVRRLEARNVGPHTLAKCRAMLNTLDERYEAGRA